MDTSIIYVFKNKYFRICTQYNDNVLFPFDYNFYQLEELNAAWLSQLYHMVWFTPYLSQCDRDDIT